MIGMLRGKVVYKQPPFLMLDVNGVGYEIQAPMSTFYALPLDDQILTLHTHLAVREDAHVLYGFMLDSDKTLFRALLKINGVGGKMALAILSSMTTEEFAQTVQSGDVVAMTRIPGVGKKTAERLIIEMRDRIEKLNLAGAEGGVIAMPGLADTASTPSQDAISALQALGYKPAESTRMVKKVDTTGKSTEDIIKAALQAAADK